MGLVPTWKLLVGQAIENLLKAYIILVENYKAGKTELDSVLLSHNIGNLARRTQLAFNDEEMKILLDLENHVLWEGRYPIPKPKKTLQSRDHLLPEDLEKGHTLYERLHIDIRRKMAEIEPPQ